MKSKENSLIILAIFGGALKKNKVGKWRTTKFNESGDLFGSQGDYLRVVGAKYCLEEVYPDIIYALGGKGQLRNVKGAPPVSSVIKNELIQLGVEKRKIKIETKSGNTFEQLKFLNEKSEKWKKLIIISNKWHLPRIKAFVNAGVLGRLSDYYKNKKLIFLSAESVVLRHNSKRYKSVIDRAYLSEGIKKRILIEKKGIKDIKSGKYILRQI